MKTYNVVTVNENSKTIIIYDENLCRESADNLARASNMRFNMNLKIISNENIELYRANGWGVA